MTDTTRHADAPTHSHPDPPEGYTGRRYREQSERHSEPGQHHTTSAVAVEHDEPTVVLHEPAPASAGSGRGAARPSTSRYDDLPVAPARYYLRWVATVAVLILLAMAANSLITNDRWEWGIVAEYLTYSSILNGLQITLLLTLSASVVGFGLGTVLALMRLSRSPLLQSVAWGYVWVFRSVPVILQLLVWYNLAYLYPTLGLGIPFGPEFVEFDTLSVIGKYGAAVLGLGLSQAAYSSEIVRAGILSVDQGQHEASAALGIPRGRQQRRIVLPQAMRTIVPTSVNEIIGLAKGTSVVFVLAYGDLFYTVQVIYGRNQRVLPMLVVAAIWYIVITTVLTIVQYYLERYYARGAVRTLPPTPFQRFRWNLAIWRTRVTGAPLPDSVPPSFASGRDRQHRATGLFRGRGRTTAAPETSTTGTSTHPNGLDR